MKSMFRYEGNRVIVSEEIRTIKEFKALYAADKDNKKVKATAWFAWLFFMHDVRSPYVTFGENDRFDKVAKDLKLDGLKMFPTLKAAVEKYKELSETPSTLALSETRDTMRLASDVMSAIRDELRSTVEKFRKKDHDEVLDIEEILKQLKELTKMSKEFPGLIKEMKVLEDEVKKEQSSGLKIKGGGTIGAFED